MNFRALDSAGDWTFGNGVQNYLTDNSAIAADISTALQVFLGECFIATNFGVDWWNLIGSKDEAGVILQCRQIIVGRVGVTKINSVVATLDRTTRRLVVTYSIDTIFSHNLSNSVSAP